MENEKRRTELSKTSDKKKKPHHSRLSETISDQHTVNSSREMTTDVSTSASDDEEKFFQVTIDHLQIFLFSINNV